MSNWLQRLAPRPDAPLRLFCFHHAGGSAATFRLWPARLPEFDVCALQLPGRANRFHEPPLADSAGLAAELVPAVAPLLDRPYVLFGHSMGSAVAIGLARELCERGFAAPSCVFVSGRQAPHRPFAEWSMHGLSDLQALDALQRHYGGLPAEALANPELIEMMLPVLRADFALLESFPTVCPPPLPLPIVAIGGAQDPWASAERLQTWQMYSTLPLRSHHLPGGHFYLDDCLDDVLSIVRAECRGREAARAASLQA